MLSHFNRAGTPQVINACFNVIMYTKYACLLYSILYYRTAVSSRSHQKQCYRLPSCLLFDFGDNVFLYDNLNILKYIFLLLFLIYQG